MGNMNQKTKRLTKQEKVKSLMDYFGLSKKEAIAQLKDAGEY